MATVEDAFLVIQPARITGSVGTLKMEYRQLAYYYYFVEPDVVLCSVSVIPLQIRSCSVCMSFVKLGNHNG